MVFFKTFKCFYFYIRDQTALAVSAMHLLAFFEREKSRRRKLTHFYCPNKRSALFFEGLLKKTYKVCFTLIFTNIIISKRIPNQSINLTLSDFL